MRREEMRREEKRREETRREEKRRLRRREEKSIFLSIEMDGLRAADGR